jgi:S1-C subfamily serine protease
MDFEVFVSPVDSVLTFSRVSLTARPIDRLIKGKATMPTEDNERDSVEAIRKRSQELEITGVQSSSEAELLAALADGTISFDQTDEQALQVLLDRLGPDVVIDVLVDVEAESFADDGLLPRHNRGPEFLETQPAGKSVLAMPKRPPASGDWRQNYGRWVAAAVAAAVILGAWVFRETRHPHLPPEQTIADNDFALQWPANPRFPASSGKESGYSAPPLPKSLPNFNESATTLGAAGSDRFEHWRLATVIVRSTDGWGSGAFISSDGWILSNYHVVASAAQRAAVDGQPASLEVISANAVAGRIGPRTALKATLFRSDPAHDLALLKLDSVPPGSKRVPFLRMGSKVQNGEECYTLGSQSGPSGMSGRAWSVRSGNVSRVIRFPEDLRPPVSSSHDAGGDRNVERENLEVVLTDSPITPGEAGGPLLNAQGELIGLNFAAPARNRNRSAGWHIALSELRRFTANLPSRAEGVPFDPWTAGLPDAAMLMPEALDLAQDGKISALQYRYTSRASNGVQQPLAITVFLSDRGERTRGSEGSDFVPFGLWGMESQGQFRFNLFVTMRADHLTAVGYTNVEGVVDEIRLGQPKQGAKVIWRRNANGAWVASKPSIFLPLIDPTRFSVKDLHRLQVILDKIFAGSNPRPSANPASADSN